LGAQQPYPGAWTDHRPRIVRDEAKVRRVNSGGTPKFHWGRGAVGRGRVPRRAV